MTNPPPLPLPLPAAPQPIEGQRGYGPQGPPPGLSPDPAVANKAANITKGLSMFMESYLGARNSMHQMYTQKVNDVLDNLASGRITLDMVDQDKVAGWIKKSGLPIRTEAFSPEEMAYKQQVTENQQAQQMYMQQMTQNAMSLPQQVAGQTQGLPPQLATALAPGIQQTLAQAQPQPVAPGPLGAPPPPPGQQAGLGGMLQRLINPAYGASANSPAGELLQRVAMGGILGPQDPHSMLQRNLLQMGSGNAEMQRLLFQMSRYKMLGSTLDRNAEALINADDPRHAQAIMETGSLLDENGKPIVQGTGVEPWMMLLAHSPEAQGKSFADLFPGAYALSVRAQTLPKMLEMRTDNAIKTASALVEKGKLDSADAREFAESQISGTPFRGKLHLGYDELGKLPEAITKMTSLLPDAKPSDVYYSALASLDPLTAGGVGPFLQAYGDAKGRTQQQIENILGFSQRGAEWSQAGSSRMRAETGQFEEQDKLLEDMNRQYNERSRVLIDQLKGTSSRDEQINILTQLNALQTEQQYAGSAITRQRIPTGMPSALGVTGGQGPFWHELNPPIMPGVPGLTGRGMATPDKGASAAAKAQLPRHITGPEQTKSEGITKEIQDWWKKVQEGPIPDRK